MTYIGVPFTRNTYLQPLHYIEKGEYPTELKIAKVIPIFKKGNYLPISLLSVFNKRLEQLICKQLLHFLEHHELLYCFQYGYRKLHSTILALIELTDSIRRLIYGGQIVFSSFIDFAKAFDAVDMGRYLGYTARLMGMTLVNTEGYA